MNFNLKTSAVAAVAVVSLVATPVMAAGQIEGGNIYRVKNDTQNTTFGDPVTAKPCEVVTFKVRIHNPGPDPINNVNVKATLPTTVGTSHSSMVTVTAADANPTQITDTAGVNLSSAARLSYVPGSTQLLDPNNVVLNSLPDGILNGGVTVSSVGVSTQQIRFVQFKAQVDCPTTTTEQPKTPATPAAAQPTTLPETGPEAGLMAMAGSGALGYAVMAYRRSKRALAKKLLNR
ncbi:hypothetical protein EPO04_01710 [Patescibacteria group bacterium]|nr:MAG: hypothetical protein EPO04_01710 [Patescibacteria group bacterium]